MILRSALKPSYKYIPSIGNAKAKQAKYEANEIIRIVRDADANIQPVHDVIYSGTASNECNADFALFVSDANAKDMIQQLQRLQSVEACYLKAAATVPVIPELFIST
ncbi:MAG: hypothetical protein WCL57_14675 [Chloroflexota bacterium]